MYKVILQAIPVLIFSYSGQVFLKRGASALAGLTWQQFFAQPIASVSLIFLNWQIMLGFFLAGIGAIFYLFALSRNDFGLIFPVLGALGFLVLPLISWLVLDETVTTGRLIGTVIIAIGMLIVARG